MAPTTQILEMGAATRQGGFGRARQTGQQGEVQLAVEIGPDGRVVDVSIRKKHASALLNRAALKAAEPLEGRPTKLRKAVTIVVPVRFELH